MDQRYTLIVILFTSIGLTIQCGIVLFNEHAINIQFNYEYKIPEDIPNTAGTVSRHIRSCEVTTNYTVHESHVESYNKYIGGDEFYMEALDTSENVVAVAKVKDKLRGIYPYTWIPLKTSSFQKVRITTQYSCGKGYVNPPLKNTWPDSGAIIKSIEYDLKGQVYFNDTKRLHDSSQLVAFGDSLMEQFTQNRIPFVKVQAALMMSILQQRFIDPIDKMMSTNPNAKQIMLNSGVWDLLEGFVDPGFSEHIEAMEKLIKHIQTRYPNLTILWKSMTGVHIHRCDCKNNKPCSNRIKYMSSSRAKRIYELQKDLLKTTFPMVVFLDMYDYTFANANQSKVHDGRHYNKEFNKKLWKLFFT